VRAGTRQLEKGRGGDERGFDVHRGHGVHDNAQVVHGRFGEEGFDKWDPPVNEGGRVNGRSGWQAGPMGQREKLRERG
jgi:hypothetical protein